LAVKEALNSLDDRQRYIIVNFYGIDCEEISLAEIGRRLNISRERVRQILFASLKKLSQQSSIISLK
jgi:RNA polymerase primary sigma factor